METEKGTENPRPAWYLEIFKHLKSRNRIRPDKIELPDCDFFIIKPGRTLRILKPTLRCSGFHELKSDQPDSEYNENFMTLWAKRPHSVNNCRCFFRHSSNLRANEKWISPKIEQTNENLSTSQIYHKNIHQLKREYPIDLPCFGHTLTTKSTTETNVNFSANNSSANNSIIKNKIVQDLEIYVDKLLNEILKDTIKFMDESNNTLQKSHKTLDVTKQSDYKMKDKKSLQDSQSFNNYLDIKFIFPAGSPENQPNNKNNFKGYTNEVFIGSDDDPDCLDFYLKKPVGASRNHEIIECVDSGINSVETMEFSTESDLNVEESWMQIMNEKLDFSSNLYGNTIPNTQAMKSNTDTSHEISNNEINQQCNECSLDNIKLSVTNDKYMDYEICKILDYNEKNKSLVKTKFDLKTDLSEKSNAIMQMKGSEKASSVLTPCEKVSLETRMKLKEEQIEMSNYELTWESCHKSNDNSESLINCSIYRSKKPIMVFLHGFGSSAEAFKHQLRYFTEMGYPCIAPEMLGHGMSSAPDKSRDYHFDKLLADLEVVLQHYAFKQGEKCVLVAHNYGCSFATALACKYSNEIHQLVLISGGGPTPLVPPSSEGPGHCCLRIILSPLLMCGFHREILYSVRGRQHPYCGAENKNQWPSHMRYVLNGMVWPQGDYLFHRRICTPTLLIHGLKDNKVSLVQECQMERTIVKAYLEAIPMAGHAPMTDTPEQVNHIIHCFIDL